MDQQLLDDLVIERQVEWDRIAATTGPGCAAHQSDTCLCDVVIPRGTRKLQEQPMIPPYVRTDAVRRLWERGTRRDLVDWLTAIGVIADLHAMYEQYADGIAQLRQAFAITDWSRKSAINAALGGLFAGGLNLEQIIALSGRTPVELLSSLSHVYSDPVQCDRIIAADKLLRERLCPSCAWVGRQVGLSKDTIFAYARRWDLKVARNRTTQIRQFIERLALETPHKTGAIQRLVQDEFGEAAPKYMATAKTISRVRNNTRQSMATA